MGAQELGWLPGPALTVWGHLPDNLDILWAPFSALATFLALGTRGQGKLRLFLQCHATDSYLNDLGLEPKVRLCHVAL